MFGTAGLKKKHSLGSLKIWKQIFNICLCVCLFVNSLTEPLNNITFLLSPTAAKKLPVITTTNYHQVRASVCHK